MRLLFQCFASFPDPRPTPSLTSGQGDPHRTSGRLVTRRGGTVVGGKGTHGHAETNSTTGNKGPSRVRVPSILPRSQTLRMSPSLKSLGQRVEVLVIVIGRNTAGMTDGLHHDSRNGDKRRGSVETPPVVRGENLHSLSPALQPRRPTTPRLGRSRPRFRHGRGGSAHFSRVTDEARVLTPCTPSPPTLVRHLWRNRLLSFRPVEVTTEEVSTV